MEYEKLRIYERYQTQCRPIFYQDFKTQKYDLDDYKIEHMFAVQKKKKRIKKVE